MVMRWCIIIVQQYNIQNTTILFPPWWCTHGGSSKILWPYYCSMKYSLNFHWERKGWFYWRLNYIIYICVWLLRYACSLWPKEKMVPLVCMTCVRNQVIDISCFFFSFFFVANYERHVKLFSGYCNIAMLTLFCWHRNTDV